MDNDVFPDLFTGFIIGVIVGAAIGFLFAPLFISLHISSKYSIAITSGLLLSIRIRVSCLLRLYPLRSVSIPLRLHWLTLARNSSFRR